MCELIVFFFEDFYNDLYYYERRMIWLDVTVQNVLYYFFLSW
jgi:hypothetical protein